MRTRTTAAGRGQTRAPQLPDLIITGDPRMFPLWVLDIIATVIAVVCLIIVQLGTGHVTWWRCLLAVLVAVPLVWRSLPAPPIALGLYLITFLITTFQPGWPLLVGGFGMVGIVITGSLSLTLERDTVVYRSALLRIALRWAFLVVITEVCAGLAWWVSGIGKDPWLGAFGLIGVAAAVGALAYFAYLPGRSRAKD